MFLDFFYTLREAGIPVSPTTFLRLLKAVSLGLVRSLEDFYVVARAIMIKSEKHFDLYDRVFAYYFHGVEMDGPLEDDIEETIRAMLAEWLQDPLYLAEMLGIDPSTLQQFTPEELVQYFLEMLKKQKERHDGGNKWIGTGGTSPLGHSGFHPGGMRVGGASRMQSAIKVAMERRYQDYSQEGPLVPGQIAEALRRLRNMVPVGPKDKISIEKTLYETMRNAGEIEIVFDHSLKDRLKVILVIDNGGWSMDPYIEVCQTLFDYARSQFKELKTYFFHNCIYDEVWEDPQRVSRPIKIDNLIMTDPETKLVIMGDASMAPSELLSENGIIYYNENQAKPGIARIKSLAEVFPSSVWLNPRSRYLWPRTQTIGVIAKIIPMFELTLDGLEKAIACLMAK